MTFLTEIRGQVADIIAPEHRHERRRLERLAMTDDLTSLANRRALDLALPTAERDDLTSIVLLDINNFGKLNKAGGHAFGDQVLKEIASIIRSVANRYGVGERSFRYGGDEFVVLCPAGIGRRVRDDVEAAFGIRYPAINVSIVGTVGRTIREADETLQIRKAERKAAK